MFAACGLEALSVDADSGAMGGTQSAEFMVLSGDGEDTVLRDDAGYAANAERCEAIPAPLEDQSADVPAMERITTPGKTTIEDVSVFLGVPSYRLIKSLVVVGADGKPALALVRGDREIHEAKLSKALGGTAVLAEASVVERVTGAPVGFAGPVGLAQPVRVIADREVEFVRDGVVGANAADAHLVHVLPGRDFPHPEYLDLRTAVEGDVSPANPDHKLLTQRGIEVGHVFNLGTRYSDPMKATFNDDDGTVRPIMMGCYGIGVSRTVAAAVEQSHDDGGIVWPITIAPFEVVIMLLNAKDDVQRQAAESLYTELKKAGVDVLLDDRDERPGSKFKDADLIGYPVQVVVGKGLAEGNLEMSLRRAKGEKKVVPVGEAATVIAQTVADLKAEIAAAVA
jgi:prolyl-tRNA synthetase